MPHFKRHSDGSAVVRLRCSDSEDDFDVAIPWEHRYDPVGWHGLPRLTWRGRTIDSEEEEDHEGIEVARGEQGITTVDRKGRVHHVPHRGYALVGSAAPTPPKGQMARAIGRHRNATKLQMLRKAEQHSSGKRAIPAGARWITVHPNGRDEKGVPVLIVPAGDGTHRIVGGAGGSLNHLRLKNVKSEAEHKEEAKKKASEKRKKTKAEMDAMTPEERKAHREALAEKKEGQKKAQRHLIEKVREKLGGVSPDLQPEDLEGLDERGQKKLIDAHHRKQWREAQRRHRDMVTDLSEELVTRAEDERALERTLEEDPELEAEVHMMAQRELLALEAEREMRQDARQVAKRPTEAREVRDQATERSLTYLDELDAEETERATETHGRREPDAPFQLTHQPSEEMARRTAELRDDAKILRDAVNGRMPTDPKRAQTAFALIQEALDNAGITDESTDEERQSAINTEAVARLQRSQLTAVKAKELAEMEEEGHPERAAKALAALDVAAGLSEHLAEHVQRLGLRDRDRTPLKDAEIAEAREIMRDFAAFRQAKGDYESMLAAAEPKESPFDRSRRGFDLDSSAPPDDVVEAIEERVLRDLATRLHGVASPARLSHVQAVAAGHFSKLADVSLAIDHTRHLDRVTMDTLGLTNSCVLLAHSLMAAGHDPKVLLRTMERLHLAEQQSLTIDALDMAESYAPGIEDAAADADDIETALRQLDIDDHSIDQAERAIGSALGQLEANATLAQALRSSIPDHMTLQTQGDLDSHLTWLAASGLTPDDYEVQPLRDGVREIHIPQASWHKLTRKEDPKAAEQRKAVSDIKRGDHDEEGWLPAGFVSRSETSFNSGPLEMARTVEAMDVVKGKLHGSLEKHIGQRVLDGERPADVERDLRAKMSQLPPHLHDEYAEALKALTPTATDEDRATAAANIRLQEEREGMEREYTEAQRSGDTDAMARVLSRMQDHPKETPIPARTDADFARHYQDLASKVAPAAGRAPIHDRSLFDEAAEPHVKEAAFRALLDQPAASAAFRPLSELTHADRAGLQQAFYRISGSDPAAGWDQEFHSELADVMAGTHPDPRFKAIRPDDHRQAEAAGQGGMFGGGMFGAPAPAPKPTTPEPQSPKEKRAQWVKDNPGQAKLLARLYPREGAELHQLAMGDRPEAPTRAQIDAVPADIREAALAYHAEHPHSTAADVADHLREQHARQRVAASEGVALDAFEARLPNSNKLTPQAQRLQSMAKMRLAEVKTSIRQDDLHPLIAQQHWDAHTRSFERLQERFGTPWSQFVDMHGDKATAYQALQDHVRGEFLGQFAKHLGSVTGAPIRTGVQDITNRELHVAAMASPAQQREQRLARAEEIAGLRKRDGAGRYIGQDVMADYAKEQRHKTADAQAQGGLNLGPRTADTAPAGGLFGGGAPAANDGGMFGARPPQASERSYGTIRPGERRKHVEAGERVTLGERSEHEMASLMRMIDHQVDPREASSGDQLFAGANMDGDRIDQQRAVKTFVEVKRLLMAAGTGFGKTASSIGAFTELHERGHVKRAFLLVPKAVEGQFATAIRTFTEPGRYRFQTGAGLNHEARKNALADKNQHMVVMTHQAATRTLQRIVGDHLSMTPEATMEHLRGLPDRARAEVMREALDKAGISHEMTYVDESHTLTTRAGEKESDASILINALTHPRNSEYGLFGSATQNKNDTSEIYSSARMVNPELYSDRAKFVEAFGKHTTDAPDSVRREMDQHVFTAKIPPKGVNRIDMANPDPKDGVKHERHALPLNPQHAAHMDKIHAAYEAAQVARKAGGVDVEAIKQLSPGAFDGVPEAKHEEIARQRNEALPMIMQTAIRKGIDQAPDEFNTKFAEIHKVIAHDLGVKWTDIKGKDRDGKRPLCFVDSVETAHRLAAYLEKQGLSAGVYHGGLNSNDRKKWNQDYNGGNMHVGILTAAGEAGINITAANVIHHVDVPLTAKSHTQRTGRAFRQGQKGDVEVHDWHTDTEFERGRLRLLNSKERLATVHETALGPLDERGVASIYSEELAKKHEAWDAMGQIAAK